MTDFNSSKKSDTLNSYENTRTGAHVSRKKRHDGLHIVLPRRSHNHQQKPSHGPGLQYLNIAGINLNNLNIYLQSVHVAKLLLSHSLNKRQRRWANIIMSEIDEGKEFWMNAKTVIEQQLHAQKRRRGAIDGRGSGTRCRNLLSQIWNL